MKNTVTFLIAFLRLTNCLNLSADNVNCVLYRTYNDYRIIKASTPEKILEQDIFNASLKTVFFIPGETTPIDEPFIRPILESYIKSKHCNLIQLNGNYYTPNKTAPGLFGEVMYWLGEHYGSVISKLIKIGLPLGSIELIGHSYGGSVALITAKNTFPKLPLLIGLEPSPWVHFQKGYADYTIALHTNMGLSGTRFYKDCDSNLIANNGSIQPQCTARNVLEIDSEDEFSDISFCCHLSALYYWSSLIDNPGIFYGVKCNETDCDYNNVQLLGPNLRTPGIFYFKTGKYYPFGLGMEGIKNMIPIDNHLLNAYHKYLFQFSYAQKIYKKYFLDTYEYYVNGGFNSTTNLNKKS